MFKLPRSNIAIKLPKIVLRQFTSNHTLRVDTLLFIKTNYGCIHFIYLHTYYTNLAESLSDMN